jgi:CubicO group peptidase (beta-lactamase class C family)
LAWQDTVGRHLPDFPNATIRDQVTIHQLLTHTSGVPSYWNDAYSERKEEIRTLSALLETFVHEPLDFAPDTGYRYSNGGPVILGLILEKITGESYYDYIRKHIYRPAGMTHTDHYTKDDAASGRAVGYGSPRPGAPLEANTPWLGRIGSPAGGGYAAAADLLRFARALDSGVLLPREQLEGLWHPERQGSEEEGYGYLWGVGETNGHRWVGHNGGAPGVSADFRHYPDSGFTVIVLANQSRAAQGVSGWIHQLITAPPTQHADDLEDTMGR